MCTMQHYTSPESGTQLPRLDVHCPVTGMHTTASMPTRVNPSLQISVATLLAGCSGIGRNSIRPPGRGLSSGQLGAEGVVTTSVGASVDVSATVVTGTVSVSADISLNRNETQKRQRERERQ